MGPFHQAMRRGVRDPLPELSRGPDRIISALPGSELAPFRGFVRPSPVRSVNCVRFLGGAFVAVLHAWLYGRASHSLNDPPKAMHSQAYVERVILRVQIPSLLPQVAPVTGFA